MNSPKSSKVSQAKQWSKIKNLWNNIRLQLNWYSECNQLHKLAARGDILEYNSEFFFAGYF